MKFTIPSGANIRDLFNKYRFLLFFFLAWFLALIPVFSLVNILETTGVDVVSNDYLRFTKLADRVLSAGYEWKDYFKDSFDNNVHSYAFLFLFRLSLAELTHLSVKIELYIGLLLSIASLFLIYSLLSRLIKTNSPFRLLLIPVLSAFVFSYSQISTFSYGETSLQMGFIHLAILFGLWMILKRSRSKYTPWVMMICGIIAAFSGGAGLLAWPMFLIAIFMANTGSPVKYLTWFAGLIISLLPYLAFSIFSPLNGSFYSYYIFTIDKVVTGLGLPLANAINYGIQEHPGAYLAGLLGIAILVLFGSLLFLTRSKSQFQSVIPAWLFIIWGLSGSVQISASRDLLAPWYTTTYILFWIGLLGLGLVLIQPDPNSPKRKLLIFHWDPIARAAGYAGISVIILLYLFSNLTYQDKSFYLTSRSPVSAACVRNYQYAPTYCEGFVFQWGVGNPSYLAQMAMVLEKFGWSVFGPHQEITLQGDTILGKVYLLDSKGPADPQWVSGENDAAASWTDYQHLNLLLSPGQSVQWQVDLPQNLESAKFQMGLSLVDQTACHKQRVSINFGRPSDPGSRIINFEDLCNQVNQFTVSDNIMMYRGKRLVILITNENPLLAGKAIRLQYPRIILEKNLGNQQISSPPPAVQPINTDLSPGFSSLLTPADTIRTIPDSEWKLHDFLLQDKDRTMLRDGPAPWAVYTPEAPICRVSNSRLFFNIAMSDQVPKRMIRIRYQYRVGIAAVKESSFDFPLLSDTKLHGYTLSVDLLGIPVSACLTSLDFQMVDESINTTDQWIQIKGVGFLP